MIINDGLISCWVGVSMKKIILALLIGIFTFSLFACVTRDTNKLDRARNENRRAQREMNRAFDR
jgi:hypothetical protein